MNCKRNISPYSLPGILSNKELSIQDIVWCVCNYFSVTEKYLKSRARRGDISFIRFICMYLIKMETEYSYREISLFFNYKDHTTSVYAVQKVSNFISIKDEKTIKALEEIRNDLKCRINKPAK